MTPEERAADVMALICGEPCSIHWHPMFTERITEAIRAAVAEEREACAKIAENRESPFFVLETGTTWVDKLWSIAAAIRARGTE